MGSIQIFRCWLLVPEQAEAELENSFRLCRCPEEKVYGKHTDFPLLVIGTGTDGSGTGIGEIKCVE